jgi:hypothetical protein
LLLRVEMADGASDMTGKIVVKTGKIVVKSTFKPPGGKALSSYPVGAEVSMSLFGVKGGTISCTVEAKDGRVVNLSFDPTMGRPFVPQSFMKTPDSKSRPSHPSGSKSRSDEKMFVEVSTVKEIVTLFLDVMRGKTLSAEDTALLFAKLQKNMEDYERHMSRSKPSKPSTSDE